MKRVKIRDYLMDNLDLSRFDNVDVKYVGGAKINHLVLERDNDSYLIVINAPNTYPGGLERFKQFAGEAHREGYKMLQVFGMDDFPELSETKNADYYRQGSFDRACEVRRLKGVAKICAQNGIPLNFVDPNAGNIEVYNFGKLFSYATHRSVRGELIEIPEGRRKTNLKDKMEPHLTETLSEMIDLETDTIKKDAVIGKFKLWEAPKVEIPAPRIIRGTGGKQLRMF